MLAHDAKPSAPDTTNALGCRLPAWLAVIALMGLTLAFYHGLRLPGLVLIGRDAFLFHLPIKHHLVERLSAGALPQWFPYEALGRPFIGTGHAGVFHPFTSLYFLLSIPDAYRASTLLSCLLAALGAFALGRTLNLSPTGSLVAGLSYALSGYVVSLTEHIVYLYSICALPLFCAALEKTLVSGRAWTVTPAVVWATVFLVGDVQTGYYYSFIALLWTAMRAPRPYREAGVRLALASGLAVLLAGIQLGPAAAVFAGSDRLQSDFFHEEALYWSTHPLRLLTVLASPIGEHANQVEVGRLFFGTPRWGPMGGTWAQSLYLGIPMSGLALLGGAHRRDLRVLAVLGVAALVLALGKFGYLYELFYQVVPLWSAFRYPEKLMGVVSFAAAMLAGAGIDALRAGQGRLMPWLAAAVCSAAAGLTLRTKAASAWVSATFGASGPLADELTHSAALALFFSAIAALGVWLVALGDRRGWLPTTALLPAALASILVLDLGRANLTAYRTAPIEAATFVPPLARALTAREGAVLPGRFRMLSFHSPKYSAPDSLYRLLGPDTQMIERRQALEVEHNSQFHLETAKAYLPGYSAAIETLFPQTPIVEVAARFNVAYLIGQGFALKDPRYTKEIVAVQPDYDLVLFRNPMPAKPRAYLSPQPERAASPVDPSALLARPDFQNGTVDVIETPEATVPGPSLQGTATIERYAPEEVRVRVESPQPALLVLLDAFDQGWTAALETGAKLPIRRANALVRAVAVPEGSHVVTFSYRAPLLIPGAWASLAGVLLCTGLLAQVRRQSRHASGRG